jgi:hypothetical protein
MRPTICILAGGLGKRLVVRRRQEINFVNDIFPLFLIFFKCRFGRRVRT